MSFEVEVLQAADNGTGTVALAQEWDAAADWLEAIRLNGGDYSEETAKTYGYHLAKLRWFCEHVVKAAPAQWNQAHANSFVQFLREMPLEALCGQFDTGRERANVHGRIKRVLRYAKSGEIEYTPFRTRPSAGSRDDIVRCVRSYFTFLQEEGVIARNPMAKLKARKTRRINSSRAVDLDLYQTVLDHIEASPAQDGDAHRQRARDRFIFVVLRELGLRASELVGAHMRDIYRLSDPKSGVTYWVMRVAEENAKGGHERTVPVTQVAMDALMAYQKAFGLPALPATAEQYGLLLSTKTTPLYIGEKPLTEVKSRRYFKSWASLTSRKTVYQVVTTRLSATAQALRLREMKVEAEHLEEASPHWLRHTFAKAALLKGRKLRVVAQSLGHASVATTMAYTVQDALDQLKEYERDGAGAIARAA